jgi:hypothetical protein
VAVTDPRVLKSLLARVGVLERDLTDCRGILDELGRTGALPAPGRRGRPEPDATKPGAGPLAPPASEPVELAASTEPLYGSLLEFVTEAFTPVYCRVPSPTLRWCASWWDHA